MMNDALFSVLLILLGTILGLTYSRKQDLPMSPFLITSSTLMGVGLLTQVPSSPLFVGLNDGLKYQEWGYAISESLRSGSALGEEQLWPGKGFWPLIIGILHSILGPVTFSLFTLNAILIGFSVVLLQRVTDLAFNVKPRVLFIVLTLGNPSILLNGPTLLREGIFWLAISIAMLGMARFYLGQFRPGTLSFLLGATLLLAIRPNFGVVLLYLIAASMIALWCFRSRGQLIFRGLSTSLSLAFLAVSFPLAFDYLATESPLPEHARLISNSLGKETVTTAISPTYVVDDNEYAAAAAAALARLPNLFFGPFPSEYGVEVIWLLVGASTLHFWVLLVSSVALLLKKENRTVFSILLFALAISALVSLSAVLTNYGIIMRFRTVSTIFLLPLATFSIHVFLKGLAKR